MEHTNDPSEQSARRLDVERFVDVYEWVNSHLPDEVGAAFDAFLDEPLLREYPQDVGALYEALAASRSPALRAMAATGIHHVMNVAPDVGVRIAAELLEDEDDAVAAQARETLRDLPELLGHEDHSRE